MDENPCTTFLDSIQINNCISYFGKTNECKEISEFKCS